MILPTEAELTVAADLVRERCGLRCDGDGAKALETALARRIADASAASAAAYLARLAVDAPEFQALVNLLTINETYFCREAEQLQLLVKRLRPLIPGRGEGEPVRILCAGCSSGEEPYSVAIALKEAFGEAAPRLFGITGADIDDEALAKARTGSYGELSFRGAPTELKDRYFTRNGGGGLTLSPVIKAAVAFRHVNLLAESTAELGRFDAILFRNVSIYFDAPTRRRIIARFADMLAEGGCLIVGASETLSNDFGLLRLVEEDGVFFFVKDGKGTARPSPSPPLAAKPARPAPAATAAPALPLGPARRAEARAERVDAERLVREKRYGEALALVAAWPSGPARSRLLAHIRFNRNDLDGAEREATEALAGEPWCVDCLTLLSQIARHRNDADSAVRWLKQAIYARPELWLPHYHLAEVYRRCGSLEKARREYAVVVQQLSAGPVGSPLLATPAVAAADLLLLCRRHLEAMAEGVAHGA